MDNSVLMCNEIIEKTILMKKKKKRIFKTQHFYMLLAVLLITITLLIAVSTYCFLIKYRVKQKQLLPFEVTNHELREVL